MAARVWDREEYLAMHRKRAQAEDEAHDRRMSEPYVYKPTAQDRVTGFFEVLKLLWKSVWHMGMYSSDPYLARIAMVHTAQEQIGVQRQIAAGNRLADEAREEQRAARLGQIQADAMIDRIEERRASR